VTQPPPPPGPSATNVPGTFVAEAEVVAVAAGEAEAAVAEALREAAKRDPVLAARLARAEAIEAALRADGMLPAPLSLMGRVLADVRAEPAGDAVPARVPLSSRGRFARAAAAVVAAALGAHLAFDGGSALAALAPPSLSVADVLSSRPTMPALPDLSLPRLDRLAPETGAPGVLLGAGGFAFAAGVLLAWRRTRSAS
jgi:hypothetical protein